MQIMRYTIKSKLFTTLALLSTFFLVTDSSAQQLVLTNTFSTPSCYVENSTETVGFSMDIEEVSVINVVFSVTAPGVTISNPSAPGILINPTTISYSGSFPIGTNVFTFDVSAGSDVGVVNVNATAVASNSTFANVMYSLSFVSSNPVTSVTCNDLVNISLQPDCTEIVTPDQILQGNNYFCMDEYTVEIIDTDGTNLGNMLGWEQVGKTLEVSVTGPNNNFCWGLIHVDDKVPPLFNCPSDIVTTCISDTEPGDPISPKVYINNSHNYAITNNITFTPGATQVSGLSGSTIDVGGIDVSLDINHPDESELDIVLISPSGTTAPFTDFDGQNFVAFNGENPNGIWEVRIMDNVMGNDGMLLGVSFIINQIGGTVALPISGGIWTQIDDQIYTVTRGFDACSESTLMYTDLITEPGCDSDFLKIITRSWVAEDAYGNISTCDQTIFVYRTDLSTLVWPPDFDGIDQPTLSCQLYGTTEPPLSVTGMPMGDFCENIQIFDFEDARIDICESSYKIVRHWKIINWCGNVTLEHDQTIKVENNLLLIDCPVVQSISTHPYACTAIYDVVPANITAACSSLSNISYTVSYAYGDGSINPPAGTIYYTTNVSGNQNTGYQISGLPIGRSWIKYTYSDLCGNMVDCVGEVDVTDEIIPNPVCHEHTIVAVNGFGIAIADAISFDNGSTDNCEVDYVEARKLTNACSGGSLSYGPQVVFCCDEIGTIVMVEMRVWDTSGNSNTCMVEVEVQDNLPPYITSCPSNMTLECFSDAYLSDASGVPSFIDNCNAELQDPEYNIDIDDCGEGTVVKTFTVIDDQGLKDVCTQVFTLVNSDPFDINDIDFPDDYEVDVCLGEDALQPEFLPIPNGFPVLTSDACDMVAMSPVDQVFPTSTGGIKILRTWTVIDWCQFELSTGEGQWSMTQVIKCNAINEGNLAIGGRVTNEYDEVVNNVALEIDSDVNGFPKNIMNDDAVGSYYFQDLESNESYTISSFKEDEAINGVTTLDLVMIQRHLLQSTFLDSPYKVIAADIDNNQRVSSIDLIHLRKLILGIRTTFPGDQEAWRFVERDYVFADDLDPWPFSESINVLGLTEPRLNENFIGIKIGDVNGDADPINFGGNVTTRTNGALSLFTDNVITNDQGQMELPIYAENFTSLYGFQFTIEVNPDIARVTGVSGTLNEMNEGNFAIIDEHTISVSWNTDEPYTVHNDEAIFTLILEGQHSENFENVVTVSSRITHAEAYDEDMEVMNVTMRDASNGNKLVLHQNKPNPFAGQTIIAFELPDASEATLSVYDVNGRLILMQNDFYAKGYNEVLLTADNLETIGLLYYTLETSYGTLSKKMLSIK